MIRVFLFCVAVGCGAAHAERTEVYAGLALLDFRSKAYVDGDLFGREDGLLPGLVVEVARKIGDWRLTVDGRFFSGNTDSLVVPLDTQIEADERMYSLSLRIGRELQIGGWSVAPYAGYGYHRRQAEGDIVSVYYSGRPPSWELSRGRRRGDDSKAVSTSASFVFSTRK